jgi:adenylate kinase
MSDIRTFLMMGRPGSGKGTQATLLAKKIGAEVYSSGNRLREIAKGHGFVNEKVKKTMDQGGLLPAWLSSHLFVDALLNISPEDKIVFEGACRRLDEAEAFDETARWLERPYAAVFLDISDAEVEKRLALRRQTQGRADDASDTVEHRIKEYNEHTAHAVELFRSKGLLIVINADQPIEVVHAEILKALGVA